MNSAFRLCIAAALILGVNGCGERAPDTASPKHFSQSGITFDYPGNWDVEVSMLDADAGAILLFVESPGSALILIQGVLVSDAEDDLLVFAKDFSAAATGETEGGEMYSVGFTPVTLPDGSSAIEEALGIKLLGKDVPHLRRSSKRDFSGIRFFLVDQVATEDSQTVEPGFAQVRGSLEFTPAP